MASNARPFIAGQRVVFPKSGITGVFEKYDDDNAEWCFVMRAGDTDTIMARVNRLELVPAPATALQASALLARIEALEREVELLKHYWRLGIETVYSADEKRAIPHYIIEGSVTDADSKPDSWMDTMAFDDLERAIHRAQHLNAHGDDSETYLVRDTVTGEVVYCAGTEAAAQSGMVDLTPAPIRAEATVSNEWREISLDEFRGFAKTGESALCAYAEASAATPQPVASGGAKTAQLTDAQWTLLERIDKRENLIGNRRLAEFNLLPPQLRAARKLFSMKLIERKTINDYSGLSLTDAGRTALAARDGAK